MSLEAVLVGPARAVQEAVRSWSSGPQLGFIASGAFIVGAGDAQVPTKARAPAWDAIDLSRVDAQIVVLTELPPPATLRKLLSGAARNHAQTWIMEGGRPRPLRLDELLPSLPGDVDWESIAALIKDKRILITGGGGSIGSELARRISQHDPEALTLLDSSEYNLHRIGIELPQARLALADVRDAASVRRWFSREKPQIVFHTAALKQVPMVEMFASEGILTNIKGLRNVAEAAHAAGADLIFVSTDKAVEPSGVMGASKRLGEIYCQALDRRGGKRALPVRLGNVFGSAGSVAPLFERQFAAGGPLTVTDPEVTRYFMSIPQAANALLRAAAGGLASEARGAAMVIDMGEALHIVELAQDLIRMGGLQPGVDMPIVFTGLRPGEKLHERLIAVDEEPQGPGAEGIIPVVSAARALAEITDVMDRLVMMADQGADDAIVPELFAAVAPSFQAGEDDERAIG